MNSYLNVWKNFAQFSGRSRRREYWMFTLINFLIAWTLSFTAFYLGTVDQPNTFFLALYVIYTIAQIIPGLAVSVRRLHDTNHSGWAFLINLIPLIGVIICLVWLARDSDPGKNFYGPNPKRVSKSRNEQFEDDFS